MIPGGLPFRPWWWSPHPPGRHRGDYQWQTGRRRAARGEPIHVTTHQVTLHVYGAPRPSDVAPQRPTVTMEIV
jgi:hypothetical protein